MVPCSTQSQFPDLWSAPLRCAHWMPILGDPGAHAVGVPSRHATPERTTGKPSPTPARSRPPPRAAPPLPCSRCLPSRSGDPRSTTGTDPHPQRSESPPAPPGLTPPRVRSRRGSSPSGGLREHNWDARPRSAMTGPPTPDPRRPGSPRPWCDPSAFPAAVATPGSTTGTAPHPRHDPVPDPRRPASPRPGRAPGALPTFTTGSR